MNIYDWNDIKAKGDCIDFPLAAQGLFINICAELWDRDGVLQNNPKVLAAKFRIPEKEFNETMEQFQSPEMDILSVKDGFIRVKFIDRQIRHARHLSETNRKNIMKRWHPEQKGGNVKYLTLNISAVNYLTSLYSSIRTRARVCISIYEVINIYIY